MKKEIIVNGQECKNIALNDNQKLTLSSKLKPTKVYIWDKELCSGAQWKDFLKCVKEKTKENENLLYENKKLKRALKLASEPRDDWGGKEYSEPYTNYTDYFLDQAEKELKDEGL